MADIDKEETGTLIASNKVEGTSVYNRNGDNLGSIYNFMVDKQKGTVDYAVLQFGGFLGIGSDYYPIPWKLLTYDTRQGGYIVDIDPKVLERAPHYPAGTEPTYGSDIDSYYGGKTAALV